MPLNVEIKRSRLPTKKFDAILDGKKVVSFGQKGASDYTMHKDEQRKDRYIQRHRANEDWTDPTSAGFYSRWVTWEKPTLRSAAANINKKFKNVHVKLNV